MKRATLPRGGPDTSSTERVTEGQERKTLVPRRWVGQQRGGAGAPGPSRPLPVFLDVPSPGLLTLVETGHSTSPQRNHILIMGF